LEAPLLTKASVSGLINIHYHKDMCWNPYLPEEQYTELLKATEDELRDIYG